MMQLSALAPIHCASCPSSSNRISALGAIRLARDDGADGAPDHGQAPTLMKPATSNLRVRFFCPHLLLAFALGVFFLGVDLLGQPTPMLQVLTIGTSPGGPVEFTFQDEGTGATNYVTQFSPVAGPEAVWESAADAVLTPLGAGAYRVVVPGSATPDGFYRVVGLGGTAGDIIIDFATTAFQVAEGDMVSPTVNFSAPFTGTIRYTIGGTASGADYLPLSGQLQVDNRTTVTIPIALTDNETIGPLRNLTLTLEAAPGTRLGSQVQSTITINENDARWEGTFQADDVSLPFTLEMIRAGATTQGWLSGGSVSFFPGDLAASSVVMTTTVFSASIGGIAMPAEATLLGLPAVLQLELVATQGEPGEEVGSDYLEGGATLVTAFPEHPHLNTVTPGRFLMQRPAVQPSSDQVELTSIP